MLLEAEQSHSLNVTKGSSIATTWNFIQSQTLALHPTAPETRAWGTVLHTQSSLELGSAGPWLRARAVSCLQPQA